MFDITIDGAGYMLAAGRSTTGSYRKNAGGLAALTFQPINVSDTERLKGTLPPNQISSFRRAFWQKWRGSGQAFVAGGWEKQADSGLVAHLTNLRPLAGGAALALAPQMVEAVVDGTPATSGALHSAAHSTNQVVSVDANLFVGQNSGTNGSGFVRRAVAPGVVRGLTVWNAQFVLSANSTLYTFEPTSGTLAPFAPATAADLLTEYRGLLFAASGATLKWYNPALGNWSPGVTLESEITALEQLEGVLYIGTVTALYRLQGTLKPANPNTAPNLLNLFDYDIALIWRATVAGTSHWLEKNFCKLTAWRGALWFWAGGRFYRAKPGGGGRLDLESQPVTGAARGIAVGGGLLVTLVRQADESFLYLNDGNFGQDGAGWWRMPAGNYICPFPNAAYAGGQLNAVAEGRSNTLFARWLLDPLSPIGTRPDNFGQPRTAVSGEVVLPLFMPEDLATAGSKVEALQLLRVGVEWSLFDGGRWWPELNAANTADAFIRFGLSRDAGATWQFLTEPSFGNSGYSPGVADFRGSRIEFPLPTNLTESVYPAGRLHDGLPVVDASWQLKIVWQGRSMPLLRRLWLDYKAVEVAPKSGLAWELDLTLSDPVIGLNGQAAPLPAQAQLQNLWQAWQTGRTLLFQDLDGASYLVKLVGLDQKRSAPGAPPACPPGWVLGLRLVEIERDTL